MNDFVITIIIGLSQSGGPFVLFIIIILIYGQNNKMTGVVVLKALRLQTTWMWCGDKKRKSPAPATPPATPPVVTFFTPHEFAGMI